MQKDYYVPLAVKMANEVLSMHEELEFLRNEVQELREYRKKYNDSINESIQHSQHMLRGILDIAMTPGVMQAIDKSNKSDDML